MKTTGLARFGVAKSLLSRGGPADVAAAVAHLEGVQKDADEAPDVLKALGILYKHEGRPELAIEYLRKAEGLDGEDPDVQEALGELLAASDPLAAVQAYERAVGLHEAEMAIQASETARLAAAADARGPRAAARAQSDSSK